VGKFFLQHGSIPLQQPPVGPQHFIPFITDLERKHLGMELRKHSTDLSTELGKEVVYEEVRDAILRGFEKILERSLKQNGISGYEQAEIEKQLDMNSGI
jgi:lipoate-protein ligase A